MRLLLVLLVLGVGCSDDPVSPCPRGTQGCMCDQDDRCDGALVCDAGTCVPGADCGRSLGDGDRCSDGNPCTMGDICVGIDCVGTPYTCVDGVACTDDYCDGAGGCGISISAGFCLINEDCYADASVSDTDCLVCDVAVSQTTWAPNDGGSCDDDDPCTHSDLCNGATCAGDGYTCDDGNHCTVNVCNGDGTCSFVEVPQSCVIDHVCYAAGMTEPGNPCGRCEPMTSESEWTALLDDSDCSDGDPCTTDDVCIGGVCGGAMYTCDDGYDCTTDTCNGDGTCSVAVEIDVCLIDEQCYLDGEANGGDLCTVCDASVNQGDWTRLGAGETCNDGVSCTRDDVCDTDGDCAGVPYVCDDDNDCTTDTCDGFGGCGVINLTGPTCNDGNDCTHDDDCDDGVCGGIGYSCDDTIDCTTDLCDGEGACSHPVSSGSCHIDEVCYADTDPSPANECQWCESTTPDGWSNNDGAGCDDGDGCTDDDYCSGGSCTGTPLILDSYEDNDDSASAAVLSSVTDDDDFADASNLTATLYGVGDVDFYRFTHTDETNLWDPTPRVLLSSVPSGSDYRLCAYFTCTDSGSSADVTCNDGSASVLSGTDGGCCSNNSGSANEAVELSPDCDNGMGGDDSGRVYVRIDHIGGAWNCTSSYQLTWGDN